MSTVNQTEERQIPGSRASSTIKVFNVALAKVLDIINERTITQSFNPLRDAVTQDEFAQLISFVVETLKTILEGFARHRWEHILQSHSYIERCNSFDTLISEARARREEDKNPIVVASERDIGGWSRVTDSGPSVRSQTIPSLVQYRDQLRAARQQKEKSLTVLHSEVLELSSQLAVLPNEVEKSLNQLLKIIQDVDEIIQAPLQRLEGLIDQEAVGDDERMEE